MKSFFTFLLLASFSLLTAQSLELNVNDITLSVNEFIPYNDVSLTNTGDNTIELAVRLEKVCYIDGDETAISICIGIQCFFAVDTTITYGASPQEQLYTMAPGDVIPDALKFTPSNTIYGSEWNVVFFDRNNEDDNVTLHVKIEECVNTPIVSTNDFAYEIGEAFPNPATEVINIAYQIDVNQANLNIYNALGMQVETMELSPQNESVSVNVANYTNGVYFYQITDGKDQSKMLSFVK